MIIIADSGATKTNWLISDGGLVKERVQTTGLNPNFSSIKQIKSVISEKLSPLLQPGQQAEIYFYGSGCSGEFLCNKVRTAIAEVFPGSYIEISSDLLGAARALLGKSRGIACILGTGSNSCLYDGTRIVNNIPPLGFILGDEGSGASLGKRLLADYLKGIMPEEVVNLFGKEFATDKEKVIKEVYRGEFPSKYIASFVVFLKDNIGMPYCSTLVRDAFNDFINRNVRFYDGYKKMKISFTGSIAWHFRDLLEGVLNENGLLTGELLKEPSERIMEYHLQEKNL
ncbi:MAG: ATPase [Bacteroidales bacterium]|jgi:N-acetylglucosamine kinase-like BadF-type ATPase|nr:ATPase [Bacteroidales bacterium]